jgi:Ca-activated chloride channel homolog
MIFGNVSAAFFLLMIAPLTLLYLWGSHRKQKALKSLAGNELQDYLVSSLDRKKRSLKFILILLALMFSVFSLMRPYWGLSSEESLWNGLDILIAVDTSKSMLAEDIVPNRLELAKESVRNLVKGLRGDRIGLIAFSGNAFLLCPLTTDYHVFRLALDEIDVTTIPKGGTSLASAIEEARKGFQGVDKGNRVLLLLSDGEDHEGGQIESAERAAQEGMRVFTISIGTPAGGFIPLHDKSNRRAYFKDTGGITVRTRLDEAALQKISSVTGGVYRRASESAGTLTSLYEEKLSKMERKETTGKGRSGLREWFQVPLALALLLLCVEPLISERKKNI